MERKAPPDPLSGCERIGGLGLPNLGKQKNRASWVSVNFARPTERGSSLNQKVERAHQGFLPVLSKTHPPILSLQHRLGCTPARSDRPALKPWVPWEPS